MTGFEPIIAKNVQKINFKFTMISIFTTLLTCFFHKIKSWNLDILHLFYTSGPNWPTVTACI